MPDRPATTDGRLVRRVRWRLIAWSTGSTFAVLLVLGTVLYAAVATTLASTSEDLLRQRAGLLAGSTATTDVSGVVVGASPSAGGTVIGGWGTVSVVSGANAALPGFAVDGPYAGTLAMIVPGDAAIGSPAIGSPATGGTARLGGPPDPDGFAAAQGGQTTLRETTWQGSPVRVLSVPLPGAPGTAAGVLQVVGDRTAELRTLAVLLAVLLGGGLAALVAAALVGWLYASRALVPIRASMQRQREFAADTSHELRTPLAVIRAGVARVRQQPDERVADVLSTLDSVDAEAVRLGALVDDLLALARTDAGPADLDLRSVDLADVAAEALGALEPMATARGCRLLLDVEPAPMTGDPERLRRLVTVLVDNALRHGRSGGSVRVTVRPGRLTVDDDGPGIPPQERARVFDRFWRGAGAAPGGSGLGLAIAAWVVDRHGGRIEVGTSPSGGARFDVSLPKG
jgi:signal transduction histidine kinase